MKLRQIFSSVLLIPLGLLMVAPGQLRANSVIDSINTVSGAAATNNGPLTTLSTTATAGGIGFTTGYDQANSQVNVLRTNDLTVPLVNYVSGQTNTANHWSIAATSQSVGVARRAKYRGTVSLTGTIWFSFLASLQNANGDIGLTLNGNFSGSGTFDAVTPGMRVGLGNPTKQGAFGVSSVANQTNLANIVPGVTGVLTATNFAPTNGTAGLVLGRISTDGGNGFRRVDLWYNPDVPDAASLPAPTLSFTDTNSLFVPTTITRVGTQVVRAATAVQDEIIDNIKLSDETNGFDIVYKNAPLPLPLLNVTTVTNGSEAGPTNVVFLISADKVLLTPLTVTYKLSGVATNGFDGSVFTNADYTDPNFDTGTQISTVTIPAGASNATVTLTVIDDNIPEGNESVILTLNSSSDYLSGINTASGVITDNNDAGVAVQYMFTDTLAPQIFDTNLTASSFNVSGVSGGFSTTAGYFISSDASIRARGDVTAADEAGAVSNGNFMSFSVSPVIGSGLSLTNIEFQAIYGNYLFQEPGAASAGIVLRSSLDNFTSDLGSWTLQPDNVLFPNAWYDLNLALNGSFTNLIGGVEFRLYIFDDTTQNQVGVRVDNLYVRGNSFPNTGAQQVNIVPTADAAEPSTPGAFTINRVGDTNVSLTVFYSVSGTASNGVDYAFLPGSATIPAGRTNVVITVAPIDDVLVESTETIQLSLLADASYGAVTPLTATVNLADDGDFGGLVGYLFNESNNGVPTLAAIAAANTTQPNRVNALNAVSGPGNGNFGANLLSGVGHGYATSVFHSSPSTIFIRGEYIAKNEADSVTQGNYIGFTLAPKPGYLLTLTNFDAYLKIISSATDTTTVFLRSSMDGFTADLGSSVVSGTATGDPFQFWSNPISATNIANPVEFRLYFYNNTTAIFRIDDVSFEGFTTIRPVITSTVLAGGNVTINFTGDPADAASKFKLQSAASVQDTFADDNTANITGSGGTYQAVTSANGAIRFYRIRR